MFSSLLRSCGLGYRERDRRRFEREYVQELLKKPKFPVLTQLLMLGPPQGGKTTLLYQMRLAAGLIFNADERKAAIPVIIENLVTDVNHMFRVRAELNMPYRDNRNIENEAYIKRLASAYSDESANQPRTFDALKELWNDETMKYCIGLPEYLTFTHTIRHFLEIIDEIRHDYWLPSNMDMLMKRDSTLYYQEVPFYFAPGIFKIIDVGGIREQRLHWARMLEHLSSAIFVFSMADYDETVAEGYSYDSIQDSLSALQLLYSSTLLNHCSFLVFLNKRDLLEKKIQHRDLVNYLPEFVGPQKDANAAQQFMVDLVENILKQADKPYYIHISGLNYIPPLEVILQNIWDAHINHQLHRQDF